MRRAGGAYKARGRAEARSRPAPPQQQQSPAVSRPARRHDAARKVRRSPTHGAAAGAAAVVRVRRAVDELLRRELEKLARRDLAQRSPGRRGEWIGHATRARHNGTIRPGAVSRPEEVGGARNSEAPSACSCRSRCRCGMGIGPVPVQMGHGVGPVWARMPARATQEPPWPRTPSRSRSRPGPLPGSKLPWRASRSTRVAGRASVHSSTRACARCIGTRRYGGRHATTPPPTQGILSPACGTLCQRMYMRHACAPHAHLKTDQLAHGRTQNGAGGHGTKTGDHAVWCPVLGVSGSGALRKRA
jgi:hypothetical protein